MIFDPIVGVLKLFSEKAEFESVEMTKGCQWKLNMSAQFENYFFPVISDF